jgi:deoxyribodipyrimidine photo-lyase
MSVQIVWFKRDLRVTDHAPLVNASTLGPILPIYVFEPALMDAEDYAAQHYGFVAECLVELRAQLERLGLPLSIWHAPMLEVLAHIRNTAGSFGLHSHEETGNALSFERDKAVTQWCQVNSIKWHEYPNNAVVRRLSSRDKWSSVWVERMNNSALQPPPKPISCESSLVQQQWPHEDKSATWNNLMDRSQDKPLRQRGGITQAQQLMTSFFEGRAKDYGKAMSSPLTAQQACSRLSPYLAYGVLSIKEVVHQVSNARLIEAAPVALTTSLKSFESRLHWHCHFIQKLESQPSIEFRNLHKDYDNLRPLQNDQNRLAAWKSGTTGFPMIDACMRMLLATGWINFRMRAMLVSFSSYQLWQHWREPALHLAREFLDYEPGIHYPQVQMQSGVTGINTIRMYNPVKQARDHDPDGVFVKRWIPELQNLPLPFLFEPWKTPLMIQLDIGCVIGTHYPAPIVDLETTSREVRDRVWSIRNSAKFKETARTVYEKHGSRNPNREGMKKAAKPRAARKNIPDLNQSDLFQ